ncbi:MAG: FAD-dependent oxidoreductase [Burkholderiaceae bacterium]
MNTRDPMGHPVANPTIAREQTFAQLCDGTVYDILIIGGGATGLGVALDAANRGLSVALVEAEDFAKGTSSRATKLLHGGVRYLAQGNVPLVREALHERTTLLRNAPHIAQPLPFVMPVFGKRGLLFYKWFYGAGLVLYDLLAGKAGLGKTSFLNRAQTLAQLPGVREQNLSGSVRYWDGQFDDARLAVGIARTAAAKGARLINHCRAIDLIHEQDKVVGARIRNEENQTVGTVRAKCIINAAGVWVDAVRRMDRADVQTMVAPSQGVHIVVDQSFMPGKNALLVPKTQDGRVLFAVPWLGKLILGTTDTPRDDLAAEPVPFHEEVEFILSESARYLSKAPRRKDVLSVWVGLRPLVKPPSDEGDDTKALSREHTVLVGASGLVTVTGGKWTTYRAMAEDVLAECARQNLVENKTAGGTIDLPLLGATSENNRPICEAPGLHSYGSEAGVVSALAGSENTLATGLTEAMVRFAVRYEYARTVEDVLARRSRLLFIDARTALELADTVAQILAEEIGPGFDPVQSAAAFRELAAGYLRLP